MLKVVGLTAAYESTPVLHQVSIELRAHELVCVIGSNGAGKTALLRSISRELTTHGHISADGSDLTGLSAQRVVELGIIQCPEGRKLFSGMSVMDNLLLGAYSRKAARSTRENLEHMFSLFPVLRERQHQRAACLSGGEQQMLAVARALMGQPKILLLDEPSFGIAPIMFSAIVQVLKGLTAGGLAILLTEQNARLALDVSDRAYVLESGRIVLAGPSPDVAANAFVRSAYLGL